MKVLLVKYDIYCNMRYYKKKYAIIYVYIKSKVRFRQIVKPLFHKSMLYKRGLYKRELAERFKAISLKLI